MLLNQRTKLRANIKYKINKPKSEEDIFRKSTNEIRFQKNHYSTETFIEATKNEINKEILQIKLPK